MFTLLMANIQGETLICVSNSDRGGARAQLHLRDRDVRLMAALPRYVPASPGPGVGFGRNADPGLLFRGTPQRPCCAGGGREGDLWHTLSLVCLAFHGGLLF